MEVGAQAVTLQEHWPRDTWIKRAGPRGQKRWGRLGRAGQGLQDWGLGLGHKGCVSHGLHELTQR